MAQVQANGITIEYEQHGESGQPLLLVMGLGGQLTDWPDEFIDGLVGAGFQVTVFDNRDIGLSSEFSWEPPKPIRTVMRSLANRPIDAGYTIVDMAADAAGLLDALGIAAAHVVGMSMGGMIAQQMTIDFPDKVRSLTSIMSNPGDGKSGRIATKVMAKMARLPAPTRETAADQSVESFKLWSSPHFDPRSASLPITGEYRPEFPAARLGASDHGDHGQPRPHAGTGRRDGADSGDPRAGRSTREAERWRRDRCCPCRSRRS